MVIVKLFGICDIIVATIFLLSNTYNSLGLVSSTFVIYAGLYLITKGLIFVWSLDFASIMDIIIGVIILISTLITISFGLAGIIILFMLIKGAMSLI